LRTVLSSPITPVYKLILPVVWVGGFALGTVLMLFKRMPDAPLFLGLTLLGAALLIPLGLKLKHVEVDEDYLYISNLRRQIAVPLSEVAFVQQNVLVNIKPARICFRTRTPFGKSVLFIPNHDGGLFRKDSVIELLRSKAGVP
jgi:hypothetical protein